MEGIGLVFWIVSMVATPIVARHKGRSACGWFVLSLLGGVCALLLVALLPSRDLREQHAARTYGTVVGNWRICPTCAEAIRAQASTCRYCQSSLSPTLP